VLVREDQLSLAIGRRGQNVRLASKLSGWDIEIMTQEELAQAIERAVEGFSSLTGVEEELANRLVEEGFLSYDDLSIIEPDALMAMGNLSEEDANIIVEQAEERAEVAEAAAADARRQKREQERLSDMAAEAGMKLAPMEGDEAEAESDDETASAADETAEESDAAADDLGELIEEATSDEQASADQSTEDSAEEPTESTT
jgi:transcription termination/antitermination protein NusA